MDVGETIKFRVIDEEFVESEPSGPPSATENDASTSNNQNTTTNDVNSKPPYRIIGAINESGLGLLTWWSQNDENAMDEEDEEEDN